MTPTDTYWLLLIVIDCNQSPKTRFYQPLTIFYELGQNDHLTVHTFIYWKAKYISARWHAISIMLQNFPILTILSHTLRLTETHSDSFRLIQTHSDSFRLIQTYWDSLRLISNKKLKGDNLTLLAIMMMIMMMMTKSHFLKRCSLSERLKIIIIH